MRRRRVVRYAFLAIFVLIIATAWYMLWLPTFRIGQVDAQGPNPAVLKQIAVNYTSGTYFHLLPRNSIFFFPRQHIRTAITDADPEVSAVSIARTSFSSIAISTVPRAEAFLWCGTSIDAPLPDGDCYEADIQGFIFKDAGMGDAGAAATSTASSTSNGMAAGSADTDGTRADDAEKGEIRVFGPVSKDVSDGQSPVRAHVVTPGNITDALKFVAAVRELRVPVSAYAIRGDEADLWVGAPTRITYVIGHEKDAAVLAESALPTLALTDGSIQYVDLRFPGKAYVKRY